MSRWWTVFSFAALALTAGVAQANPYSLQVLRTRAVPGPHVQISYGVDNRGGSSSGEIPTLAATYGSKQTPWDTTSSYRANTGSGVVGLHAVQSCDCFVPKGVALAYETTLPDRIPGPARNITLKSTITVTDSFDAAVPAPRQVDGAAWLDPEPAEVQGLDCTTACLRETLDASADVTAVDAPVATAPAPDAAATTVKSSKGCSFGGSAPSSALPLLGLLALLALGRRRHS